MKICYSKILNQVYKFGLLILKKLCFFVNSTEEFTTLFCLIFISNLCIFYICYNQINCFSVSCSSSSLSSFWLFTKGKGYKSKCFWEKLKGRRQKAKEVGKEERQKGGDEGNKSWWSIQQRFNIKIDHILIYFLLLNHPKYKCIKLD